MTDDLLPQAPYRMRDDPRWPQLEAAYRTCDACGCLICGDDLDSRPCSCGATLRRVTPRDFCGSDDPDFDAPVTVPAGGGG
jgi:hypothetical protein